MHLFSHRSLRSIATTNSRSGVQCWVLADQPYSSVRTSVQVFCLKAAAPSPFFENYKLSTAVENGSCGTHSQVPVNECLNVVAMLVRGWGCMLHSTFGCDMFQKVNLTFKCQAL